MKKIQAQERLIVALDLEDVDAAEKMVKELDGAVTFFKIGLVLQLARGVDGLIRELIGSGKQVFLDYKYYDVEETLRKAVSRASNIGVSFLTIHGSSGLMKAAVRGKGSSSL
ncbi:MAG: orotidine 5'-phosphate decarboxylase / HUMPS family protein, partial [Bryobacteraceae bacterium]